MDICLERDATLQSKQRHAALLCRNIDMSTARYGGNEETCPPQQGCTASLCASALMACEVICVVPPRNMQSSVPASPVVPNLLNAAVESERYSAADTAWCALSWPDRRPTPTVTVTPTGSTTAASSTPAHRTTPEARGLRQVASALVYHLPGMLNGAVVGCDPR